MYRKKFYELDPDQLDGVSGGAWTGGETEMTMVCAGCRAIRLFKKDEWDVWRCIECSGSETMKWQDL